MITRFESYLLINSPASNLCDACGKKSKKHTINIFSAGLTGQQLLFHFCDECMEKDSIVFETIAKV